MWLTLALLVSWFGAAPAEAQTDAERAGARSAATSGADAFDGGRYQEALDLFLRAESLVHSPVHLSYIGQCQANLGYLVEAHETYIRLSREELPANAREAVKRAVSEAGERAKQLEPRLPYLAIKIQGLAPGEKADVTLNGTVVPPGLVGIPAPTNPGEYVVRATAPGKDSGDVTVTLQEGQRKDALVTLQSTGAAPAPTPAAVAASDSSAAQSSTSTPHDAGVQAGSSNLKVPAYVALGVGVVGVGLGTYFALDAGKAADEADEMCGGSRSSCSLEPGTSRDDVESKNDQAGSSRTLAIVGFVVGGAGLAAGATMLVLSMRESSEAAAEPKVVPYVGFGEAGLVGRF